MKDSKRKSVNAFHLFFVCPKTLNALVRSVSVCNSTSPKLEAKSQMKPYKNGPHGFPKCVYTNVNKIYCCEMDYLLDNRTDKVKIICSLYCF